MSTVPPSRSRTIWLRDTLTRSRKDTVSSSVMTGICDNYLGAFAVSLRASLSQMGWLMAAPQLAGAVFQLLSVWLCPLFSRRRAIVTGVVPQALSALSMGGKVSNVLLMGAILAKTRFLGTAENATTKQPAQDAHRR